jgi:hypothetical protein
MNVLSNNENIVRNITGLIKKKSMKNLNKNTTRKKQNSSFIVYIHIRPDINEPFYVGKGVPGREIRTCGRNQYWHNIVNKNNGIFESKILFDGLSEEEALLKERETELELRNKGYVLANIAECGVKAGTTGMKHSEEFKHKMSEYWKQYYNENPSPKKGIKMSKESSLKKSKAMKGKKVRLGIKDSEETRKKKSIGIKNRDPKWIEKRNKSMGDKLKDLNVYIFQHLETKEVFKGTRKEFEIKFNLNGGRLSQLINNKVLKYKNWIKI